ncbi:hypothetical protein [Sinorhizobium americanum]|uniref:Uncharacterized protein n=1 Tax=Sinorhizobium americanum TaxID=194963 RepID=A0A4R2BTE7_9HYPH|nr:hypothetical protein [Sinorhizobium americanum]TCN30135.1 hypothetical protein EV184_1081 [Sinorhizobium americanum]
MTAALFTNTELLACEGLGLAPILMTKDETLNLKAAVHVSGRSEKTIRNWCKEFGIGSQACPGGPLEISAPALEMVRRGDIPALELLREGRRDHPRVRRYYDFLGLVP